MYRLPLCLVLLGSTLSAQDFSLQQVSDRFPSAGFEEDIHFWRQMFTHYGETQVVFHDRRDLRLVYEVIHFERGVEDDPVEAEQQQEVLKEHKEKLQRQLKQLAQGISSSDYSEEQSGIVRALRRLGYEPDAKLYRRLSDQLRFQRGLKEKFQEGIARSGRYWDYIEEIFLEEGVPRELAVLPHIESSFVHEAHSKAGAVGLWQFVRSTGRHYLTINRSVDQRFDPLESTRAAAKLLKSNYRVLGSWPLAITAYNHGANGMKRAKRRYGDDMLKIARNYESRLFGFASRNFYPEFLAALEVHRNHEQYFGQVSTQPRIRFETVRLNHSYRVADVTKAEGIGVEVLKQLNPALRPRVWKRGVFPARYDLRVPAGARTQVASVLKSAKPWTVQGAEVAADGSLRYRVRRGDNLAKIAGRFGVSTRRLAAANRLSNRNLIYPGQMLTIPPGGSVQPTRYKVRRGDTLLGIALRFGKNLKALMDANNLRNANRIFLGQILLIP